MTARHSQPVVVAHRLPIRRSGVGTESLGTFAMHGWLYMKATCLGTGKFEVSVTATSSKNGESSTPACLNSSRKPTLKSSSNFGVNVHRARIDIRAPADMKWSIIIFEGPVDAGPKALNVW